MKDSDQAWLKTLASVNTQLEGLVDPTCLRSTDVIKAFAQLDMPILASYQSASAMLSENFQSQLAAVVGDGTYAEMAKQMESLYSPTLSALKTAQDQYSEYFNAPALSLFKVEHEEWLAKMSSASSMLESINSSRFNVWESINESIKEAVEPYKIMGFDSIKERLGLVQNVSTSAMAGLVSSNIDHQQLFANVNSLATQFSGMNDLFSKYSFMAEALANLGTLDWGRLDADFNPAEALSSWEEFAPLEVSELDETKHFEGWFKELPVPVQIAFAFVALRFIEYLMGILINVTTPYWQERIVGLEPDVPKKEIIANANEYLDPLILAHHRFVDVKTILRVRAEAGEKFEIIDTLRRGKIVKLIEKRKAWSLIEYYDADTANMSQGWVYSRYLNRLDP